MDKQPSEQNPSFSDGQDLAAGSEGNWEMQPTTTSAGLNRTTSTPLDIEKTTSTIIDDTPGIEEPTLDNPEPTIRTTSTTSPSPLTTTSAVRPEATTATTLPESETPDARKKEE